MGDNGAVYIPAYLTISNLGIAKKTIIFELDTGASRTVISQGDAEKIGIDFEKFKEFDPKSVLGIGGRAKVYVVQNATLQFQELGRPQWLMQVDIAELFILYHGSDDSPETKELKNLPSLLGRDLLGRSFRLDSDGDRITFDR